MLLEVLAIDGKEYGCRGTSDGNGSVTS